MRVRRAWWLVVIGVALSVAVSCARSDMGITNKVKAKLAADDVVKVSQIEVETRNGVVTLNGNVDSEEAKNRALDLARGTPGVVSVVDMIASRTASGSGDAPEPERTVGDVIDDSGITMSVKSQLLDDPQVKGLRIDVDTRAGVVFLTGSVGSVAEKETAIQLARNTKGVRDVQANLTIKGS